MGFGAGNNGEPGFSLALTEPFIAAKEERPVVHDRSANGCSELIALEFGQTRIGGFLLPVKKVSRIEIVVAVELIKVAVEFVAARFGDGGDDSAGVPPIFGAVRAGQHPKLPQHLHAEQVPRGAARCVVGLIVDICAVQKKAVGVHAAAAYAHLDAFALIGLAATAEVWS